MGAKSPNPLNKENEDYYMKEQWAPGQIWAVEKDREALVERKTVDVTVANTGDRPIQVGSHFHFFEVNKALRFDRVLSFGYRLAIPAGTAVRFEPGLTQEVKLIALGGSREVFGLNSLTEGSLDDAKVKKAAIEKMQKLGFNHEASQ